MSTPDYGMMKRLLAIECEAVVEALAATAKWEAGELHAQFPNGLSVVMAVRGNKRGVWLDKTNMSGGDTLELVHRALGKEDHRVAYDWGKRFLGLPDDARAALAARREVVQARQIDEQQAKRDREARMRDQIGRYLFGSKPFIQAPEIASYLAGRGIPPRLPGVPKTLRFARAEYHREDGREWSAMVAPIVDPLVRQIVAVHRTFLGLCGAVWRKAPVKPQKKVSGPYKGSVIPLLRGASGRPLGEAPQGDAVLIAEGIENALAAAWLLRPGQPGGIDPMPRVFAAISAPNLPNIKIPPQFAEVILICDRDHEANQAVQRAYDQAERRWLETGLAVSRQMPPVGFKDFAAACEAYHAR
jgi:hypothetical protein